MYGLCRGHVDETHGNQGQSREDELLLCLEAHIQQIHEIKGKLKDGGIASFTESDIAFVLGSTYANGDDGRAIELFQLISDSEEGVIRPYTPDVRLVGAVNRNKSTCYLDATLFAMFSQLDTFEAMLYHNFDDPPRRRLSIWVRIWVNCLRSGKLITPEIVSHKFVRRRARCADPP